eukprot:CAMPEP_0204569280 /NCGR_PEP_ID=MMETSP0661-20131031/37657_1 /ASSEMBLY_ACC=CAM_ASM_000606 /TAXON_ID=109239 /ORGANISM="Alexandrium margalefi, Strain AMGDE01CS-322" /LENGTH=187 /DNA_ID=CAMNT_0051577373 /DNA_START=14 /DNA_END=577 /DNA_ORIENTATION=-
MYSCQKVGGMACRAHASLIILAMLLARPSAADAPSAEIAEALAKDAADGTCEAGVNALQLRAQQITAPFSLRSGHDTRQCLDWAVHSGNDVGMWQCHGDKNQQWVLVGAGQLVSEWGGGMCLDWDIQHGDSVHMNRCHSGAWQQWEFDGRLLRSRYDRNKCLDWDIDRGTNVHVSRCHGLAWQQWLT